MKLYMLNAVDRKRCGGTNSLVFQNRWTMFQMRRHYRWLREAGARSYTARSALWDAAWVALMDPPTFLDKDGVAS